MQIACVRIRHGTFSEEKSAICHFDECATLKCRAPKRYSLRATVRLRRNRTAPHSSCRFKSAPSELHQVSSDSRRESNSCRPATSAEKLGTSKIGR